MRKLMLFALGAIAGVAVLLVGGWFVNPFGVRDTLLVNQIVKMRVAPNGWRTPKTLATMECSTATLIS